MNSLFDYSEIEIGNLMESSILLERFFKPIKKKVKTKPVNLNGEKLAKELGIENFNDFKKFIYSYVKKEITTCKKDPNFKARFKKSIQNLKDDDYDDEIPRISSDVLYEIFYQDEKEITIRILEVTQEACYELDWIMSDILDVIDKNYKDLLDHLNINMHDNSGDEGLLTFELK